MKICFIKNIIGRFICWIALLQIINISINPPDFKQSKISAVNARESHSLDEIESIYELVVETFSDETVPESDEDDIDTSSQPLELYFITRIATDLPAVALPLQHHPYYPSQFSSVYQRPNAPPPKLA